MAGDDRNLEVVRFIQSTIDSVDELEVLLFLMSNPERSWTAAEIGERIRVPKQVIEMNMLALHRAHLLAEVEGEAGRAFAYAPSSRALAREVGESLQTAYRERREALFQLIYTRPLDNIRVFADAFRIRKEEED